jgi:AbrB family looped-hinge helix DNA binding protein
MQPAEVLALTIANCLCMMAVRRMFVPETKVDEFGRVVIPKGIRSRLGLRRGTVLEIDEVEEGIVLRPGRAEPPVTVSNGVLVFTGTSAGDLDSVVRRQRDERLRSVASPPSGSKR